MIKKIIFILLLIGKSFALNADSQSILIYNGPGTSPTSVQQALKTFSEYYDHKYNVKTINLSTLRNSDWEKNTEIFIMPGGADRPYHQHLKGELNSRIKKFVKNGGKYIGICAGAYYGSSSIIFAPNTELEIIEDRELKFFPGIAYGPVLAPYDYKSNSGVRAASISTKIKGLEKLSLYYNGGCAFKTEPVEPKNFQILARYVDLPTKPAAIILCKYGKGSAFLSGVHFEYDPSQLDISDQYLKFTTNILKTYELKRQKFISNIMKF